MKKNRFSFFVLSVFSSFCAAQTADFSMPDTICEDKPVIITNVQPVSANSYQWSFCSGNATAEPDGINIGNPNQLLNGPISITLVQDNKEYFTFTTSSVNSKIVRCSYGASLTQNPLIITDLGSFGAPAGLFYGIQVKKDKGVWYGFVAKGNTLLKLNFGASLAGTPSFQDITYTGFVQAQGLAITKQDADWVGFVTDAGNNLYRLYFGQDLDNDPVVTAFGNIAQLMGPTSMVLAKENDNWYAFICNITNSTLSRIAFGASLLNPAPVGASLPRISGCYLNAGITLINDCGGVSGFVTNNVKQSDQCVVHLVFKDGLGGPVTGYNIINNGILNIPCGISEVVRQGETLYAFVANYGSSSITRIFFPSCTGASQPFYTGYDPPPVTYSEPGNYNVLLTVDEGFANQSAMCKKIVVAPKPDISLGPDLITCQGQNNLLDAGAGDSLYQWSTGAATQTITVDTSGTYWVRAVNSFNCEAYDTIVVTVKKSGEAIVDTTVCKGLSYLAQHALQHTAGVYHDTLQLPNGCDSIVTTNLQFEDCPLLMWFPNAFTPNGDGTNDEFKPVGNNITKYKLQIYDRWGALIFESNDIAAGWNGYVNGKKAGPDVYTFQAVFETSQFPGVSHRETGTVTLAQ
jgi:gliding motility-associated-like protein